MNVNGVYELSSHPRDLAATAKDGFPVYKKIGCDHDTQVRHEKWGMLGTKDVWTIKWRSDKGAYNDPHRAYSKDPKPPSKWCVSGVGANKERHP